MRSLLILAAWLWASEALAITNSQALAEADAYIASGRRGSATVHVAGLPAGSPVAVRQTRLDWNYGAAIHAAAHLDRSNYVAKFQENFNTVVAGGPGYWLENEATRDVVTLGGLERVVDFARDHGLYLRGHNLIYERDQPAWVKPLGNSAMRAEISERIDYYAPLGFDELDVYNESYNGGELGGTGTYWNRLGQSGVAAIYNETAAATDARLFVNDYAALQGAHAGFAQHIDALRAAGASVEGIGLEYYSDGTDSGIPVNFRNAFDTMAARGLPTVVSEWGQMQTAVPEALRTSIIMAFGHPNVTGFYVWDWTNLPEWSFATPSALYKVSGNTFTITPMGKMWQDIFGIHDWDGNPNNGFRTSIDVMAAAGGSFSFTGYYGDYIVTAGGNSYALSLTKGVTDYTLGVLPGDFNADGRVDAADYTTWRDRSGSQGDYQLWRANFEESGSGGIAAATGDVAPEADPHAVAVVAIVTVLLWVRR